MHLGIGSASGKRQIQGLVIGLIVLGVIWMLANWIISGSDRMLIMAGLVVVLLGLTVQILQDFLIGIAYFSFFIAKRNRRVEVFQAPFRLPLLFFFWFAVIQVFNVWSPNILYGLLGLKLYFYYVPLMFLGYAMLERPKDLERLLIVNIGAGIVIAGLGIAQSVLGVGFLTPDNSADDLYALSHVIRYSPLT